MRNRPNVIAYRTPRKWRALHPSGVLVVLGIILSPILVWLAIVALVSAFA